ncbi:MAG: ABC transporter permease, partial [candidate division Zixibacteria bacterium]|nr:ABC transporter permease [candidate division Zixibacteria bacterium]
MPMRSIRFLALKELYHILRDPRSLAIAIAMPLLMTFLYGYAVSLDINNVVISVIDYDQTAESRQLIDYYYRSTYFGPADYEPDRSDPEGILRRGNTIAILTIKSGLATALENGQEFELGLLIDGSDNTLAAAVQGYSEGVVNSYLMDR